MKKLLILILFITGINLNAWYFSETFVNEASVVANGWQTNFFYGRDGIYYIDPAGGGFDVAACLGEMEPSFMTFTNGRYFIHGTPNRGVNPEQSIRCGNFLKHNTEYSASEQDPFGFTVIRTYAEIDPVVNNCKNASSRQQAAISAWMFVENDISNNFETYPDFISFYDFSYAVDPQLGDYDLSRSKWGYFNGANVNFDMTAAPRPVGGTVDLTTGTFNWEWNYDDDRAPAGTPNNNPVGLKITHNGSVVKLFINPDPYDGNSYPNEYLEMATIPVFWTNRIKTMLGHEVNRYDQEAADGEFDDFLIRSVSSGTRYYPLSSPDAVELVLDTSMQDAGATEIIFRKCPALDKIIIGGAELKLLKNRMPGKKSEAGLLKTSGGYKVILFQKDENNHMVLHSRYKRNRVTLTFKDNFKGAIYIDNIPYEGMKYPVRATTGEQKSVLRPASLVFK